MFVAFTLAVQFAVMGVLLWLFLASHRPGPSPAICKGASASLMAGPCTICAEQPEASCPARGIDANVAERCLGHVIPGVLGVYDRHDTTPRRRGLRHCGMDVLYRADQQVRIGVIRSKYAA